MEGRNEQPGDSKTDKVQEGEERNSAGRRSPLQIPLVEDTPKNANPFASDLCKLHPVAQEQEWQEEAEDEGSEENNADTSEQPNSSQYTGFDYSNSRHDQDSGFRIFLGGLTGTTTSEDLEDYFSNLGAITEAVVVTDPNTKKPSGFGFLTVKSKVDMEKILAIRHTINGSNIDCKAALTKSEARNKEIEERKRKLFVAGLPKNLSDETLHDYFTKFGKIQKAYVVKDFKNGSTRGFGFVIFDSTDGYDKAIKHTTGHNIQGKDVFVRETNTRKEEKQKKTTADDSGLPIGSSKLEESSRILGNLNDASRIHDQSYSQYPLAPPGYPEYPYYPATDPYAHLHHPGFLPPRGLNYYPPHGGLPYPYEDPYYPTTRPLVPIPGYQISYQPVYRPIYPTAHHPQVHPLYSPQLGRHPVGAKPGMYPAAGLTEPPSHQIYHPYYHHPEYPHPSYLPPTAGYPPGYPQNVYPEHMTPKDVSVGTPAFVGGKGRSARNNIGKLPGPPGIPSLEVTPISKKTVSPQSAVNKGYNYPLISPIAGVQPKFSPGAEGNFTKMASPMLESTTSKPMRKLQQIESKYSNQPHQQGAKKTKGDFVASSKSPVGMKPNSKPKQAASQSTQQHQNSPDHAEH